MIEVVAALALAPWAQPLRFRPLSGWSTGANGTFDSSYGPEPADLRRRSRLRGWREAPPTVTRGHGRSTRRQPSRNCPGTRSSFSQSSTNRRRTTKTRVVLRLDRARRYACCDGTHVAGGEYALAGARTSGRIFSDRARLLRLASDALHARAGTTRPRPPRATLASIEPSLRRWAVRTARLRSPSLATALAIISAAEIA